MTQPRFKIKKGDVVEIIAGKNKGKRGSVEKVFLSDARVIVSGVNVVRRHLKPSQTNPDGYVDKTLPIHISNVSLIDPTTNKPGRVKTVIDESGAKTRVFKKTNTVL